MSALSSAKELAQLCLNVLSVSISAAGLRHFWKRVATGAQWGWSRSLSATAISLTFLSPLLKNPSRIIKRTWLHSAQAVHPLWWQIRWDRDEMRLRLHSGPVGFYNPPGKPRGPGAAAVDPCLSISPHSSSNPPRVLLINTVTKATEVFWLVFSYCSAGGSSSLFLNHTNLSSPLWLGADF